MILKMEKVCTNGRMVIFVKEISIMESYLVKQNVNFQTRAQHLKEHIMGVSGMAMEFKNGKQGKNTMVFGQETKNMVLVYFMMQQGKK